MNQKTNKPTSTANSSAPKSFIRRIMATHKRNIQNLSALVFVNFAVAGVGFITQVKIANVLGRESFGYIAYGMAIATYCAIIIRFGLDRTLVRDLIHYPDRFTSTIKASLILRFILLSLVILLVVIWKLFQPQTSDISWGVVLIIIANAAMSVDLQGLYDSWHKMGRHAFYNLLQRGLYFLVIWSIIITNPDALSVFSIGITILISVSIYLTLQYSWAMRRLPKDAREENPITLAFLMARKNVFVWIAALAGLSFGPLNQLILKYYHGSAELGGYAVTWMMVTLVSMLLTQVARVGNPATAQITAGSLDKRKTIIFLTKYVSLMLLITTPVAFLALGIPELILDTFFQPEYASSANTLRVMGGYMLVFAIGLVASQYMLSARMEKLYMYSLLLGGIVGLLLCLTLIPSTGSVGAAWALLLSHGLTICIYWGIIVRKVVSQA